MAAVAHLGEDPDHQVGVEIMFTADCPNVEELQSYLAAQHGVTVTATFVEGDGPAPPGFAGSPTVLMNGSNPFGGRAVEAAACALSPPTVRDVAAELQRIKTR